MQPIVVIVGPLGNASANNIALAQMPAAGNLVLNGTLVTGGVATLDQPRTVLITTTDNESANKFTLQGTDWAGSLITETIVGPNNMTGASVLSYQTITKILNSGNVTANVTVGTTTTASSPWVRMDSWAMTPISIQTVVAAAPLAANYTIQQTLDDPNSPTNPVSPANMTWTNNPTAAFVGNIASQQGSLAYIPTFIRCYLNSGNATVAMTVIQPSAVPY